MLKCLKADKRTVVISLQLLVMLKPTIEIVSELCSLGIMHALSQIAEEEDQHVKLLSLELLRRLSSQYKVVEEYLPIIDVYSLINDLLLTKD